MQFRKHWSHKAIASTDIPDVFTTFPCSMRMFWSWRVGGVVGAAGGGGGRVGARFSTPFSADV